MALPGVEAYLRAAQASFNEEKERNQELTALSPLKFQIGLAISIIFLLGSICLIAMTHQIPLPTGSTPFNPLRAAIYVVGSGTLVVSLITTLAFAGQWWNHNHKIKKSDDLLAQFAFSVFVYTAQLAQERANN